MSNNKLLKKKIVEELNSNIAETKIAIVFYYHGLAVADINALRRKIRDSSGVMKIVKNKLAKIAIKNTNFAELDSILNGPTAIAYSEHPTFVKAIVDFAKENESLKIVGGVVDEKLISAEGVKIIASLPSMDELRAKIIGLISAPATRIAGLLHAVPSQVARVISAHVENNNS